MTAHTLRCPYSKRFGTYAPTADIIGDMTADSEKTPKPEYPVDVVSPGNHRLGTLQYPTEGSSSLRGPVLVIDGKVYGAPELPEGSKVVVHWREACTGPVWELIRRAMAIGQFPIEIIDDERDDYTFELMAEITRLRSELRQSYILISELQVLLARAQPKEPTEAGKHHWWMFWRR